MSRCVVYQSGGFTNYGISYRKYSQEELAEMENRTMTENDAIRELEWAKNRLMQCSHMDSNRMCAFSMAIKALEEVQQYRALGTPEECRAAMEKQTAISREIIEGKYFCPKCHNLMRYPGKAIDIVKAGGVDGN